MWDAWKFSPFWFTLWYVVAGYIVDTHHRANTTLQVFIIVLLLDLPDSRSMVKLNQLWSFHCVGQTTCRVFGLSISMFLLPKRMLTSSLWQWRLLEVPLTELGDCRTLDMEMSRTCSTSNFYRWLAWEGCSETLWIGNPSKANQKPFSFLHWCSSFSFNVMDIMLEWNGVQLCGISKDTSYSAGASRSERLLYYVWNE